MDEESWPATEWWRHAWLHGIITSPYRVDVRERQSKGSVNWINGVVRHKFGFSLGWLGLIILGTGIQASKGGAKGAEALMSGTVNSITMVMGMLVSVVIFYGALKMKNLENYGLSMASAVLAVIPCTSPCCILGIPIGIWAIVVLNDESVKNAF